MGWVINHMFVILFRVQIWGTHFTFQETKSYFFLGGSFPSWELIQRRLGLFLWVSWTSLWKMHELFFTWAAWRAWALPLELFLARTFENPLWCSECYSCDCSGAGLYNGICWFQESLFGFWYFRERNVAFGKAAGREYRGWVISGCHFAERDGGSFVCFLSCMKKLYECLCCTRPLIISFPWGILPLIKVTIFWELKFSSSKK